MKGPVTVDELYKSISDQIMNLPQIKVAKSEDKIAKPLNYDGYEVCCIQSKALGRFYWDCDHNRLDWTTAEGEEVSFSPAGWKKFMEEMPKIAAILGVTL